MRGALVVHPHLQARKALHERPGCPGVVQVDMRQEQGLRLLG